ncbi:MAG: hypothetical protein IT535_12705 [Bauldia sp.]|nr:hypothetical protein [Bauldia sp.]
MTGRDRVELAQNEPDECHPSYAGKCVPIASDVDCAGGEGNGPAYVEGPLRVVGPDVYRLDTDGDGIACEPRPRRPG